MPELPEVETVRRGLAPHIEGRRITDFTLHRADLRFPFPKDFEKRMRGAQVKSFNRRAKYLLAEMQDKTGTPFTWLSHLGMTGRFMLSLPQAGDLEPGAYAHEVTAQTAQKHIHVEMRFDDGTHLSFADPRRFGFMDCFSGDMSGSSFLAALGPEPLGNDFNDATLLAAARGRKTPVKNFLLDQNVVAGLGNIYVCEALFMAGISPRRQATNLGAKRIARLVPAIRNVLARAIEAGGSTLRDFAHEDGSMGYFQHQFAVYGRAGEACSVPDCSARLKRLVQSGRSSFYCPACQK
ncbi:MAG: bifunctional DNA-formamidopyrimidine glycosylase/DNA-(apurinic or apyrimidinic site) lyase [Rhodobiaceae bacterium]